MRGHRESWTDRRDPRTASTCEIIEMLKKMPRQQGRGTDFEIDDVSND